MERERFTVSNDSHTIKTCTLRLANSKNVYFPAIGWRYSPITQMGILPTVIDVMIKKCVRMVMLEDNPENNRMAKHIHDLIRTGIFVRKNLFIIFTCSPSSDYTLSAEPLTLEELAYVFETDYFDLLINPNVDPKCPSVQKYIQMIKLSHRNRMLGNRTTVEPRDYQNDSTYNPLAYDCSEYNTKEALKISMKEVFSKTLPIAYIEKLRFTCCVSPKSLSEYFKTHSVMYIVEWDPKEIFGSNRLLSDFVQKLAEDKHVLKPHHQRSYYSKAFIVSNYLYRYNIPQIIKTDNPDVIGMFVRVNSDINEIILTNRQLEDIDERFRYQIPEHDFEVLNADPSDDRQYAGAGGSACSCM